MNIDHVSFEIADVYNNYELVQNLIELKKEKPEWFIEGLEISSVFGSFPSCIWNGERILNGYISNKEIKEKKEYFKENNISVNLTFNNRVLNKHHIHDVLGNKIAEIFNEEGNVIEVHSPELEKHIRKNYKKFKIAKRITEDNIEDLENDKYDFYILSPNFNHALKFLDSIKHPEKIIIVLNDACYANCKKYNEHFDLISKKILEREEKVGYPCECGKMNFFELEEKNPNFVKIDFLLNELLKRGITHYRIEGRGYAISDSIFPAFAYYLINPANSEEVLGTIQQRMLNKMLSSMSELDFIKD